MQNRIVSIIIPVYNVAPYLDACLQSVCGQSYERLEIILTDDGSTDGSGEICDAWGEKDPRVRVIHQANGGVSSARNAGLRICTGDLICFVDADDWLELEMIEKLVRCLTENGADAAMCGFVDYTHGAPVEKGLFPVLPCNFSGTVYQMIRRNGYFTALWGKLFRRERVYIDGQFVQFDPSLSFGEDEMWLYQLLRHCEKTAFLPEALYYWRPREGSATRQNRVTEKQLSILDAKEKTLSLLPDDAELRALAKGRIYNDCYSLKVLAYCTGDRDAIQRISRAIRPMFRDWICSPEFIMLRKCKLLVLNAEILLRLPAVLVRKTDALTH